MRRCEWCDKEFSGKRRQARFCCENCRKRACEDAHRARCPKCGDAMKGGSAWKSNPVAMCRKCREADRRSVQWRRRRAIQLMYEDGASLKEIAEALGYGSWTGLTTEMHRMRADGWDVPYRYDYGDGAVERMREATRATRAREKAQKEAA